MQLQYLKERKEQFVVTEKQTGGLDIPGIVPNQSILLKKRHVPLAKSVQDDSKNKNT